MHFRLVEVIYINYTLKKKGGQGKVLEHLYRNILWFHSCVFPQHSYLNVLTSFNHQSNSNSVRRVIPFVLDEEIEEESSIPVSGHSSWDVKMGAFTYVLFLPFPIL
jgi:hypothetical protein